MEIVLSILLFPSLLHSTYRYIGLHVNLESTAYIKVIKDLLSSIVLRSPSGLKKNVHTREFGPQDLPHPENGGQPKETVQFSTCTNTWN